jgi:3-phenylpropionate/trans-cinnamate dioxygenase ferredoxin reductase subunit
MPDAPIVVVGAGFIGAEVAASARTLGCRVTMLEVAPVPLSRVLGPEMGHIYTEVHRSHGVDVRCGVGLQEIRGDGRVTHVVDTAGNVHEAVAVVIGVGLVPNDDVAISSGIEVGNGVVVDEYCRTSAPDVFAAGDITYHPNPLLGRSFRVEQWQSAQHQGRDAARNMLGAQRPFSEIPWFWSDQYDLNLQMAGVPAGIDARVFRGDVDGLSFSVFYLVGGVLEGVVGVNRVADVRVGRRLVAQRLIADPDTLSDESVDLSELVASAARV